MLAKSARTSQLLTRNGRHENENTYFTGLVSIYSEFMRENRPFGVMKTTLMLQSRGSIFCSIHDGPVRFKYRTLKTGIRYKSRTGTHPYCPGNYCYSAITLYSTFYLYSLRTNHCYILFYFIGTEWPRIVSEDDLSEKYAV